MDNVFCTGSETHLVNCSYDPNTSEDTHNEDAGVQCFSENGIKTKKNCRTTLVLGYIVIHEMYTFMHRESTCLYDKASLTMQLTDASMWMKLRVTGHI